MYVCRRQNNWVKMIASGSRAFVARLSLLVLFVPLSQLVSIPCHHLCSLHPAAHGHLTRYVPYFKWNGLQKHRPIRKQKVNNNGICLLAEKRYGKRWDMTPRTAKTTGNVYPKVIRELHVYSVSARKLEGEKPSATKSAHQAILRRKIHVSAPMTIY